MAVDSVTNSSNAYASTLQSAEAQRSRQAQQTQQAQPQPKPEDRVEKKEEQPKPVVNAQGQTTGTLINVTA